MLRVSFDVAVSSDEASYESSTARPAADPPQHELGHGPVRGLGHRFADLSEDDYGVALLNDCKYGYKALAGPWTSTCCAPRPTRIPTPTRASRFSVQLLRTRKAVHLDVYREARS